MTLRDLVPPRPYPWPFTLRWPLYLVRPSVRRWAALEQRPLAHRFHAAGRVVRLACFGDLMGTRGDRVPRCSEAVRAIFARAELVVGNCESPVTHEARSTRARHVARFALASDFVRDTLAALGTTPARCVLSIANNHSGDHGAAGLRGTRERLAALGATPVGALDGPARPVVVEVAGRRLGFVAFTRWMNRACGGVMREADLCGAPWAALRRELRLDALVAMPHWDWEFQHFPARETIDRACALAAGGFDLIVGHHSHMLQPIAWLPALCHFSLGNLTGRTLTWPHRLTAVLEVELDFAANGPIAAYRCHPLVQIGDGADRRLVHLGETTGRLRARLERRLAMLV